MTNFHIDATNLQWLEGLDERQDHCLHGHGIAVIGERTLEYDCTVSSTALYLLKSLTEDHIIYEAANQMLPCCGHFMFPDSSGENVHISGCPNGIDWTVRHIEGAVELILEDGYTVTVPMGDYRREVLAFARKIEDFYDRSLPKDVDTLCLEDGAYPLFWKEWHRRKEQACLTNGSMT